MILWYVFAFVMFLIITSGYRDTKYFILLRIKQNDMIMCHE